MRIYAPFAVAVLACSSSSKHPTTGKFEDCYYDCKPGQKQADKPPVTVADNTAKPPAGKLTPTGERAQALREAADQLDKAQAALANGNKNLAELLFSTAEQIAGADTLASIASTYREGAPPRVAGPTQKIDTAAARQPIAVGSSEQEDADAKIAPPRVEGSLTGVVMIDGK